jgi:general secretion pathway protein M
MRLNLQLDREQALALGALALMILIGGTATALSLGALSDAANENAERRAMLTQLESAQRRGGPGGRAIEAIAPEAAFLAAPTVGLASAQLQAYVTRLVAAQRANLASSGSPPAREDASDAIRLQATFDMPMPGLQTLLYELETGTPYVFVESLSIQPQGGAQRPTEQPLLHVTINLRALWRRTTI